jgi:hypothetical protein
MRLHPGYCGAQDTFYVGNLKGVGRVYQQTFIDTYAETMIWRRAAAQQHPFDVLLEAGLISERTKAALAAAKARGIKLGNPNGARALRGKQTGNKEAVEAIKLKAQEHATNLRAILDDIRAQGMTSIRKIAEELNRRAILTPRGGEWQPTTVVRLLARLSA